MKVILYTSDQQQIEFDPRHGGFQPWQAIPCLRCGVCCTRWQPPLDEDEVEVIARGMGMTRDRCFREYVQEYPPKPTTYLIKRKNNACIFLRHEGGRASCAIHPFRPAACRNWAPSLFRPECQEGLRRRQEDGVLVLPEELYPSDKELACFCRSLKDYSIMEVQ